MDINNLWAQIAPYLGGITLGGVISCIFYAILRSAFDKTINRIDVKKISDTATEKGVEKIKDVTFTHSIQPIVESRLQEIDERTAKMYRQKLSEVQKTYMQLIEIMDKFSAYFNNSIGVAEEDKKALREAIEKAKIEPTAVESTAVIEEVKTKDKVSQKADKAVKTQKNVNVVR